MTTALAVHAERLHCATVLRRVCRLADAARSAGGVLSFFVYPQRLAWAGVAVAAEVGELVAAGHELGQHTHFYLSVADSSAQAAAERAVR